MIQKSSRKEIVEFNDDVMCDKCGKSLKVESDFPGGEPEFYGMVNTQVYGGFNSPALDDGIAYTFDLCEFCIKDLFKSFKRQPRESHSI